MAASVQAADPTAAIATPGVSFAEYSSPTPVGQGQVDSDTLFFIDELTGVLGKSWYIFFDPQGPGDISATLTFDSAITGVFSTKAALDGSNATYGAPGINYGTSTLIGLEATDSFSFLGNVLTIDWRAIDPGDHIRVFTALPPIPEPETYVLLMAGLAAVGFIAKRRPRT
ncbi:MAG: PEP-CTERM sorting domain-containing protein [Rhizobiales bacterium]|nr:PEP-CTERM sorting domain-containing protein [Rhizobacter sp.]